MIKIGARLPFKSLVHEVEVIEQKDGCQEWVLVVVSLVLHI